MPLYVLRCTSCGAESEVWRHSCVEIEYLLREWECRKCGARTFEKIPQRTEWMFGDKLRGK